MSDESDPTESEVIAEAERIVKDALTAKQAAECPEGLECPVHFRVDSMYFEDNLKYARLITYVGDYAVITEDNPEAHSALNALKAMLGLGKTPTPRWCTFVFFVGEGVIADLTRLSVEARLEARRYKELHDDWEYVDGVHTSVVLAVQDGIIDLDKSQEG